MKFPASYLLALLPLTLAQTEPPSDMPSSAPSVTPLDPRPDFPKFRFTPFKYRSNPTAIEALGYTEATWSAATLKDDSNPIEFLVFSELSDAQKSSAEELGFTEASWDCWVNHFEAYDWATLPGTSQMAYERLGWNETTWDTRDLEGAFSPQSEIQPFDALTAVEKEAAESVCYTKQLWDEPSLESWIHYIPPSEMVYPKFRFTLWDYLDSTTKNIATQLNYTQSTWDDVGLSNLEKRDWFDIGFEQQQLLIQMGFDQPLWDCYVIHFGDHEYEELFYPAVDIGDVFVDLGYTNEGIWNGGEEPPLARRFWRSFPANLKLQLERVCYNAFSWDDPMFEWPFHVAPDDGNDLPVIRGTPWGALDQRTKGIASGRLGYTRDTWNTFRENYDGVEGEDYWGLTEERRGAVNELGFDSVSWNCHMNHFEDFEWATLELPFIDVAKYYEAINFTQASWDGDEPPPPEDLYDWSNFTSAQQAALETLCWTEDIWQETVNLASLTEAPSVAPVDEESGVASKFAGLLVSIAIFAQGIIF